MNAKIHEIKYKINPVIPSTGLYVLHTHHASRNRHDPLK